MPQNVHTITAEEDEQGQRLDKFLAARLPEMSRSRLQTLIAEGHVLSGEAAAKDASAKVRAGQTFTLNVPEPTPSHLVAQDIALDIVYEDKDILIINKPAGLTVHPGAGNPDGTLVNALLAHCGSSLSGVGGVARPGIVHRIDKETSGLLAVAKNDTAHLALSSQLADRSLKRTYAAICWGAPSPARGMITGNIGRSISNRQKMAVVKSGGKPAITHYKTIAVLNPGAGKTPLATQVECQLETGRTHQIRVHFLHIGHPLVGDPVYGQTTKQRLAAGSYKNLPENAREALLAFNRQALHAQALELIHPTTNEKMKFACELPADMQSLIRHLST